MHPRDVYVCQATSERAGTDGEIKPLKSFRSQVLQLFHTSRPLPHIHVAMHTHMHILYVSYANLPSTFLVLCLYTETSDFKDKILIIQTLIVGKSNVCDLCTLLWFSICFVLLMLKALPIISQRLVYTIVILQLSQ